MKGELGYTPPAMDFLHHTDKPDSPSAATTGIEYFEIDTSRRRRWVGQLFFLLFFAAAAVVLVALFARFTGNIRYALALVAFMLTYMLVMGYLAGKHN
jgi:hypothetical protein